MGEDWKEVCECFGEPYVVTAHDVSYTKRRRAYWTNINLPEDWKADFKPLDPDSCMDPGRKVEKYLANGRLCVRPIGASWTESQIL